MRAFITGINGFAGVHLGRHLLAAGDRVAGCTRFGEKEGVDDAIEFALAWDMGQGSLSAEARDQLQAFAPDVIYHLAALSIPLRCGKIDPTPEAVQSNVGGTRELLEVAARLKHPPRIVFISSSHVYGAVTATQPYCDENYRCEPASAYGKTKVAAEQLLQEAVRTGVDVVIARAFHHTGPGQLPPGMVPSWTQQLLDPAVAEMKVVTLGANLDVSDVRDVVAAYRLLGQRGRTGEAYNIGSGRGHVGREIMQLLMERAGIHKPVTENDPTGRQNPIADCRKIERDVGWKATTTLAQTLEDVVTFWRNSSRELPK